MLTNAAPCRHAGIMSLPHAMAVLGLAFGTILLMLIYWLAYYTLKKLVQ